MTAASPRLAQRLGFKLVNVEEAPVLTLPNDLRCGEGVNVAAILARCFKPLVRWQVTHLVMGLPVQRKSSYDGMRVKLILPPTLPPSGGFHGPMLTAVFA